MRSSEFPHSDPDATGICGRLAVALGGEAQREATRAARFALLACGLWLRVGLAGLIVMVTGPVLLFAGDATPLTAAVLTVAGGMLATRGWRNAGRVLDRIDAATDAALAHAGAECAAPALARTRPLPVS